MTGLKIQHLSVTQIRANPWNPNVMDPAMFAKAIESIHKFGFVDPVTVREDGKWWQMIDGEHRWKAAKDHSDSCHDDVHIGMLLIPAIVLEVDDETAQQLTIVLNDLRGKSDPDKLADLVRTLSEKRSTTELESVLPFRRQQLAAMVAERRDSVDWQALQAEKPTRDKAQKERWVERVFRMPGSAADVLDEALLKVKEAEDVSDDWRALELIAADYMGS